MSKHSRKINKEVAPTNISYDEQKYFWSYRQNKLLEVKYFILNESKNFILNESKNIRQNMKARI